MKNKKYGNEFANDKNKNQRADRLLFFLLGIVFGFCMIMLLFFENSI